MDRVVVEVGIQEQGVGKRQAGKRAAVNNEENNCVEIVQTESEYAQWKEQQPEPPTGIREREKGKEMIKYQLEIKPAILPKERHKIQDVLKKLGYQVNGGGTNTDMSACDISFERKSDGMSPFTSKGK